jgi:hypothetical protein
MVHGEAFAARPFAGVEPVAASGALGVLPTATAP